MTPEELEQARLIYKRILDGSADKLDRNEGWLAYGLMLGQIDEQVAQINLLKSLLIEERANAIRQNPNRTVEIPKYQAIKISTEQLELRHPEAMK